MHGFGSQAGVWIQFSLFVFLVIHVLANFFFLSVHHDQLYLSSGHPASGCPLVLGVFIFFDELSAACIKGFLNEGLNIYNLVMVQQCSCVHQFI